MTRSSAAEPTIGDGEPGDAAPSPDRGRVERPYDLLLLDFGGVCLLHPVELHDVAEAALDLEPGTLTWLGPLDPSTDGLWQELTSGTELREREYWTRRAADVGAAAGRSLSVDEYMDLIYSPPSEALIRPGCRRVVDDALDAGLSVTVLTNDLRTFHGEAWEAGIDLLDRVDRVLDCSELGVLKPDRRAFEWALTETGHAPDRILFVDDQVLSVEGARDVGLDALWFDIADAEESWAEVGRRIGVTAGGGGTPLD